MTERTCENCRWWSAGPTEYGYCSKRPPIVSSNDESFPSTHKSVWCGEWADASITPEQAERRELVRKFALSIVEGWYASANRLPEDQFVWPEEEPWRVWEQAEIIVEWEGRKEGDGPEEQT
jgi:hypothetical protein